MKKINSVSIKGFRSLADVELTDLPNVAVMVGANGSGKSNFLRFFEMLHWMMNDGGLRRFVASQGRANSQLYGGAGVTQQINANISLSDEGNYYDYRFGLEYTLLDELAFCDEAFKLRNDQRQLSLIDSKQKNNLGTEEEWNNLTAWNNLGKGHEEAKIVSYRCDNDSSEKKDNGSCDPKCIAAKEIVKTFKKSPVYQFHNTSLTSNMKASWPSSDNLFLRSDAANLSSILFRLERENTIEYSSIKRDISSILPIFEGFAIEEENNMTQFKWKSLNLDKIFEAGLTSDGSLRLFALLTLLNLPSKMLPDVIFLDEPELGMHPAAISLVGSVIDVISQKCQVILATQSPLLVDEFDLDDIIVFDLNSGKTLARQLEEKEFEHWLDEYTTGELWQKNVIGGRP